MNARMDRGLITDHCDCDKKAIVIRVTVKVMTEIVIVEIVSLLDNGKGNIIHNIPSIYRRQGGECDNRGLLLTTRLTVTAVLASDRLYKHADIEFCKIYRKHNFMEKIMYNVWDDYGLKGMCGS